MQSLPVLRFFEHSECLTRPIEVASGALAGRASHYIWLYRNLCISRVVPRWLTTSLSCSKLQLAYYCVSLRLVNGQCHYVLCRKTDNCTSVLATVLPLHREKLLFTAAVY
eukprot:6195661-Pleurochrysis_carterae.AAC.1